MKRIVFLSVLILSLSGCIQPSEEMIRESIAETELAGVYEKTEVAATELAKATPTIAPTPLGRSSGKILHGIYKSEEEGTDIFIINIANLEKTQLAQSNEKTTYNTQIASHNGKKIAYSKCVDTGVPYYENSDPYWTCSIYIMDINGENNEKISSIQMDVGQTRIDYLLYEVFPSWSPDDNKLAFVSNRSTLIDNKNPDDNEIYVIDLITYEIQQLTKARGFSQHPSWSSDGEYITFMSDRDGDWDIYYMKSDGSGKDIKITNNTATDRYPSWSNDGNKIIYHSDRDGNFNLYIYDFIIEEEHQLTNSLANEGSARWSPDDAWIVYVSDGDGDPEIFIMNLHSKEDIKITDNQVNEIYTSWIP